MLMYYVYIALSPALIILVRECVFRFFPALVTSDRDCARSSEAF